MSGCGLAEANRCACRVHLFGVQYDGDSGDLTTMGPTGKSSATRFLEEVTGGPLTFGNLMEAIRLGEGLSQAKFARQLGMSRSFLCDMKNRRKSVSLTRATFVARTLGYSEKQFVRLALQELVDEAGLKLVVKVEEA